MKTGTIYTFQWPTRGTELRISRALHIRTQRSAGVRPRISREFEFHFVVDGSLTFQVDGQERVASAGDLMIFGPEQAYGLVEGSRAEFFHAHFSPGCPYEMQRGDLTAWARLRLRIDPQAQAYARALCLPDYLLVRDPSALAGKFTELMVAQRERRPGHTLAVEGLFVVLLLEISAETLDRLAASDQRARFTRAQLHVRRALEFISKNLGRPLALSDVAQHLHVNDAYLARLFKAHTGETVGAAIVHAKVAHAKERLLSGHASMKEIAAELGYHDPLYFTRQFRKCEGMPPSQFAARNSATF